VCIRHSHAVANPVLSSFEVSTSLCFHSVVGMPVAPRFRTEFDLKYRIAVKNCRAAAYLNNWLDNTTHATSNSSATNKLTAPKNK
jgi:hypothetical protein